MVTAAHQLNSVYIDTDAVAATTIGGITRKTINTGVDIIKENNSGSMYPEAAYVSNASPSASLTTTHCEEILVPVGVRAMCITSATNTGVHLWARKLLCSGIAAGGSHQKYTFRNGILIPTTLTCNHQGNAAIDFQIFGVALSALAAMVVATDQAILTDNTVNTDRWTLWSASVGGTALGGQKNVSINFGNTPLLESADGDMAPTFASVQETAPMFTFRGIDPVGWWVASGGLAGVGCTHANTIIYLKQRGIAVGDSAHIKITAAGLAYSQQAFDASGNATGEMDLIVECTEDSAGTAPMTITVNSAIS